MVWILFPICQVCAKVQLRPLLPLCVLLPVLLAPLLPLFYKSLWSLLIPHSMAVEARMKRTNRDETAFHFHGIHVNIT